MRPSELIGIGDIYTAYQFDAAVAALGRYVDNKLEERDKKTLEPVYRNLDAVLATARKKPKVSPSAKPQTKKPSLKPPNIRRRKKKKVSL